ncbi:uncharacterized protein [Macrobrachium rosenbergii]|uniref:uncharacterized protein n=1 Tax=Macrobrachium rosenbergii TaxID=79674 RepID=UPI0034D76E6B
MKWHTSKYSITANWVVSMCCDPERVAKSFALHVNFSGIPPTSGQIANYICQLYGKDNIKEIQFGEFNKALVVLEDPLAHDDAVQRFKSCMFSYSSKGKPKRYVRMDVYTVYPMVGIVEFCVEGAAELTRDTGRFPEHPMNVLLKLMRHYHPSLRGYQICPDWDGKEESDRDIVIRFLCVDVQRCRHFFFKRQRQLFVFGERYKVFYVRCMPAFNLGQHVSFPEIALPEFTCIQW